MRAHKEPTMNAIDETKLNAIGMRYYRSTHPRSRRSNATAIEHNGGKKTVFGCLCGARHSCATSHREVLHVALWCADHSDCAQNWIPLGLA